MIVGLRRCDYWKSSLKRVFDMLMSQRVIEWSYEMKCSDRQYFLLNFMSSFESKKVYWKVKFGLLLIRLLQKRKFCIYFRRKKLSLKLWWNGWMWSLLFMRRRYFVLKDYRLNQNVFSLKWKVYKKSCYELIFYRKKLMCRM